MSLGVAGLALALFFGTFVSEDLACLAAGSLAASGQIDLATAIAACIAGIVVGDLMLFGFGRVFGAQIIDSRIGRRLVSERGLARGTKWLQERGAAAILLSRFSSGLRLPVYTAAGALRMDPRRFAAYVAAAALVWTPLIVGAAALWQMSIPGSAILAIVAGFLLLRFALRMISWKNRRLFWGRIQRLVQWEFWPLWVFYTPVLIYIAFLAIRYRGLPFTAANPAIPQGGMVGESKNDIYRLIETSPPAQPHILRYAKLSGLSGFEDAKRFLADDGLSYPVVIKPDAGERGNGVSIVNDEAELRAAIDAQRADFLIQEFFEGVEASIFYYRRPGEPNGHIFSITEKIFPVVVGDGVSTLEQLILRDKRAFIIAKKYFAANQGRLDRVPERGENIRLVNIGSHSKGAIFRDGGWLRTPVLEQRFEEICRGIEGFYFGRFDIRAASFDDLRAGRNLRIIELNGVTSESTNIYDPRYSLVDAYKILFHQWRLAFAIGKESIASGRRSR